MTPGDAQPSHAPAHFQATLRGMQLNLGDRRRITQQKAFQCPSCWRSFDTEERLFQHQKEHSAPKQFKCRFCNYRCRQKGNLRGHERTHTGERPYSCEFCSRSFRFPSELSTHRQRHMGGEQAQCPYCTASFPNSTALRRHQLRVHRHTTKNFRVRCGNCRLWFPGREELKTHICKPEEAFHELKCSMCCQAFQTFDEMRDHDCQQKPAVPTAALAARRSMEIGQLVTSHAGLTKATSPPHQAHGQPLLQRLPSQNPTTMAMPLTLERRPAMVMPMIVVNGQSAPSVISPRWQQPITSQAPSPPYHPVVMERNVSEDGPALATPTARANVSPAASRHFYSDDTKPIIATFGGHPDHLSPKRLSYEDNTDTVSADQRIERRPTPRTSNYNHFYFAEAPHPRFTPYHPKEEQDQAPVQVFVEVNDCRGHGQEFDGAGPHFRRDDQEENSDDDDGMPPLTGAN